MIKDVKKYINTVYSGITKAFDIQNVEKKDEIEFWKRAAILSSQKKSISFQDIARWVDIIVEAPVHFVYHKENNDLNMFGRHVITDNFKYLDTRKIKDKKQLFREFENRIVNLETSISYAENFKSVDTVSFTIGRCQYIPLSGNNKFWGIYCYGPYARIPENFQSHIPVIAKILWEWLTGRYANQINLKDVSKQRLTHVAGDYNGNSIQIEKISYYLLNYLAKIMEADGAILSREKDTFSVFQSVNIPEEILHQTAAVDVINSDFEQYYKYHQKIFKEHFFNFLQVLLIGKEDDKTYVYLFYKQTNTPSIKTEGLPDLIRDTLSQLIRYDTEPPVFVDTLLKTYYNMERDFEKRQQKTYFHTPRVIAFCKRIAPLLNLAESERRLLVQTAKLHDVGYICSEDRTIGVEIKHPLLGKRMLEGMSLPTVLTMGVAAHEEWVDGSGTPFGLEKEEIPWTAKIISIFEFVVQFIENNNNDRSKNDTEWIDKLTQALDKRGGKEFDSSLIPTVIELLQSLGWDECCKLGIDDEK